MREANLASARAGPMSRNETVVAKCRITIAVAPGVFVGSIDETDNSSVEALPLTIDVPDITLLGSFVMPVDGDLRATGNFSAEAVATTIVANPGLISIKTGNVLDKYAERLIAVNGT